jgi:hypothetical protein
VTRALSHADVACPDELLTGAAVRERIADAKRSVLFVCDPCVVAGDRLFERMAQLVEQAQAGIVFADAVGEPRIDYQAGSIRDDFDFGLVIGISVAAARVAFARAGAPADELRWGGLYDLRLKIGETHPIVRIPEPLYSIGPGATPGATHFAYVDPRQRDYQIEMETVATAHLRRIGAQLAPAFAAVPATGGDFPVRASVVIPVRNRARTVAEAVASALSQKTPFPFNVIVVDNHSSDGTGDILRAIGDPRLLVLVPERHDLGIGGCWNLALSSPACGRYAVQLDSDDLYAADDVLARMVASLERGPFAMVVGSYTLVDFSLREIPPGLVDHREWTRENGRNNLLRVNGLGAPRGYDVSVVRRFGFPNVSYGEDYAMGLRVSRDFEIGRVFDPVYLCRRWEGNTDSALPRETKNRYDHYKDWLRTAEIRVRQQRNGQVRSDRLEDGARRRGAR